MKQEKFKVEYIDTRTIYFPVLKYYRGGVLLPAKDKKDNILTVTDKERRNMLKLLSKHKPRFVKIEKRANNTKSDIKEISEE